MVAKLRRRCISCGASDQKSELLRFVVVGEALTWDERQRLPGRGCYVHRRAACWAKLGEAGRWERGFRSLKKVSETQAKEVMARVRKEIRDLGGEDRPEMPNRRRKLF